MAPASALVHTSSDLARSLAPSGPPQTLAPLGQGRETYNQKGAKQCEDTDHCVAPEPQPPVPFILLLLLVSAGVLAVLPLVGACNFQIHRLLLQAGAALIVPLLAFQAVSVCGHAWLLERFFEGDYSEGATARQLKCLWYPEKVQILEYTTGQAAGHKIETYATWETTAIVEYVENVRGGNREGGCVVRDEATGPELHPESKVRIHGLQRAPELNGMHGTCQQWIADQGRWRVQLQNGASKDVKPENLQALDKQGRNFRITIPDSFGTDVKVTMRSSGELSGRGLPFQAEFDGSAIVAKSGPREGQAWRKAGYWRLDVVTKVLIAMAVVGLESMFAAAVLPPGVVSEDNARLPLKAVFLVDGSSSITAPQWTTAIQANKKFIADFADVYSSDQAKLNFGFVQFSSDAHVELPITHDLSRVIATLDNMQHRGGNTNFDRALELCQQLLDGYTDAGPKTFDVCVLLTDGEDTSYKSDAELKSIVAKDTAVFGIFVGSSHTGGEKLHQIVGCGKAEGKSKQGCDFFASATDFDGLVQKTHEIAEDVAHGSDLALCAERSAIIEGPVLLGLILPSVLWYLSCCTVTIAKRRLNSYNKVGSHDFPKLHDQA